MNIRELVRESHEIAKEKGWWNPVKSFGELVALFHSEASESLEDFRNGHSPTEIWYVKDKENNSKPCGIPIEFADIVIRVADACGWYGIDLEEAIEMKQKYNRVRKFRHGGKAL